VIRVLLVDDQHLVREGFARLLRDIDDIEVVGEAADGASAVTLARKTLPDLVLMDVRMPGMDGVEATARIVNDRPEVRVLMLTTFDLDEAVHRALRAGASGFLLKDTPYDQLVHAIRVVSRGDSVLAPSVTRRLIESLAARPALTESDAARLARLTDRESQVLHLIAQGMSNAEIGEAIFLSEATVKTHVGRVLTKLGCRDRVQAAVFAFQASLATQPERPTPRQ
jgi:DNA-binding NarL/FixJ family response regulator